MRESSRRKIQAAELTNVEVVEADAAALPFDDNTFDAVISASAIYTLPDIPAALQEWRRVLKRGGLLAFSSLGAGNDKLYMDLLAKYGVQLPPVMPLHRVNSVKKCSELLSDAGLAEIHVTEEQLGYSLESGEQVWEIVWYTGARIPLMYMPPPVVAMVKAEFIASVEESRTEHGVWVNWPAIFSLARKP
jgi:SAM-dependent methyltransferase